MTAINTTETAVSNIQRQLRDLKANTEKTGRIVAFIGIELAKIVGAWEPSERTFKNASAELRRIASTVVAQDENRKPVNSEVQSLMGHATDATKLAVLLNSDAAGFVAGYARTDGQKELVTQEQFDGMPERHQANFAPEVFCDFSKTFPKEKNGKNAPKPRAAGYFELATTEKIRDAHKRHFLNADLNAEGTGFLSTERASNNEDIASHADFAKTVARVVAYLKTDAAKSADDEQFEVFKMLASESEKAVKSAIQAGFAADALEAQAKGKKSKAA